MPLPWWPSSLSSCSTPQHLDDRQREHHRRLTRAKQLRHLRDQDIKDLDFFLNSPDIDPRDRDLLRAASLRPQPLPLPDLSTAFASADKFVKEESKLAGYRFRLPAPTGGPTPSSRNTSDKEGERAWAPGKEKEKERLLDQIDGRLSPQDGRWTVDPQRNMDAQRKVDVRWSVDGQRGAVLQATLAHAETWSSMNNHQKISNMDRAQENFSLDGPFRSAPATANCSPMLSPQRMLNLDTFALHPGEPKTWSDPLTVSGLSYLPVPESSMISRESSPLQSPPMKSPIPARRSTGGSASPRRPKLSIDISSSLHDGVLMNVHPLPLPLPPTSSSSAQCSPVRQVPPRPELVQVKDQWTKGKLIGRGTFGSVYIATNRETGALCAMKEVELFPEDPKAAECIRQLEQEIRVLSQLKHPNIVQYYGSEIVDDRFYIYLEYVYPGSINKYVREHCGAVTEAVIRNFTRHILSGLAYLHARKTIHRDIKGANLLVDSSGVVKLADFGMAKHLTGQAAELSLKGSPYWMAPELMQAVMQKDNNSDVAYAIDIWSLGCTIIEMLTGKPPWSDYEGAAAMFKVLKESPPIPETLSPEGKDFLQCCFRRNPAERPSAGKLLEHPFLRNFQQLDVSSTSPEPNINLLNLNERSPSPRDVFDHKLDKLSSPSRWATNGKGVNNETGLLSHVDTPDLTVLDSHHSPRSTLESATSPSPPCSAPSPKFPVTSIRITLSNIKNALSGRLRK